VACDDVIGVHLNQFLFQAGFRTIEFALKQEFKRITIELIKKKEKKMKTIVGSHGSRRKFYFIYKCLQSN